jgi:hypothetical protein
MHLRNNTEYRTFQIFILYFYIFYNLHILFYGQPIIIIAFSIA